MSGAGAAGRQFGHFARFGLAARAVVYLVMGWLAVLLALGEHKDVDQRGVLVTIADTPLGTVLLWILAAGLASYAVWRFSEVIVGVTGERDGPMQRAASLVRGLAYSTLTVLAISVLMGSRQDQSQQQEQQAQTVMTMTGGRWLVGAAGIALVLVGGYMVYQGLTTAFMRQFGSLPPQTRTVVVWLGRIGSTARGVVFAIAGLLLVAAAWQMDPEKAGGIDDAFRLALGLPFGTVLVLLLALGLIVFGVYGMAEALWRRVPDEDPT